MDIWWLITLSKIINAIGGREDLNNKKADKKKTSHVANELFIVFFKLTARIINIWLLIGLLNRVRNEAVDFNVCL